MHTLCSQPVVSFRLYFVKLSTNKLMPKVKLVFDSIKKNQTYVVWALWDISSPLSRHATTTTVSEFKISFPTTLYQVTSSGSF